MSDLSDLYLKKIQSKPSYEKYKSFLWADFIELLCLVNNDGELSENDIIDRLLERERDLFEGDDNDLKEIANLDKEENDQPTQRAEISIQWETNLSAWFNVLFHRQTLYAESYPFKISADKVIKRKTDQLTEQQKLYLYLLLCSNLYLFDKKTQVILASSFELISFNAFKNILPAQAEVHLFGANPLNTEGKFKDGSLWQKINKLSKELNEAIDSRITENHYRFNTGDGGLDLVAWIPTGDTLPSSIIHFAQCACTEQWISKQDSSSHNTWSQIILFKNSVNNTVFIPFCYRQTDGSWFKIQDIRLSFLIDRKRLMHYYLQKESFEFNSLPAYKIIEELIDVKENIF